MKNWNRMAFLCCLALALGGCAASRPAAKAKQRPEPVVCTPVEPVTLAPQAGAPRDVVAAPAAAGAPVATAAVNEPLKSSK